MNSIFQRVSVRKYQNKEVSQEQTEQIIKAGMQAPSACNLQPWEFYVIKDNELKAKLAATRSGLHPAEHAPLLILTVYRENVQLPEYNTISMSTCLENMWLEATSLGLGAVWLGIAPFADRMQAIKDVIDLPEGIQPFALLAVGYPEQAKEASSRFDLSRIHYL